MSEKEKTYELEIDEANEPEELSDEDLEEVAGGWEGDPGGGG